MPEKHALLSASAADRWLHCTPSARLTEHLPDKPSPHSEKGTLAHAIAELKLRKYCTVMNVRTFNAEMKKLMSDPLFEKEMAANTDAYMDHIKAVVTAHPPKSRPAIYAERRVDYGHVAPEGFGTADCIVVGGGELHIIDYKNGSGVKVAAEENPQLKLYALGAMREFELLYDIVNVYLTIVQPNAGGISTWVTTPDALRAWAEEIRPIAQAAHVGKGDCVTGDWCQFCRLLPTCPAQRKDFSMFRDLTEATTDPASLEPDELSRILGQIEPVARWMSAVREYALEQILAGADVPGWKTVEGKSNRAWSDQAAAFKALVAGGIDEAILYKREPLSLAAIEKEIGKPSFNELAAAFVTRPAGAPTLAPATDKRPAFTGRAPEQVFKEIPEEKRTEESLL